MWRDSPSLGCGTPIPPAKTPGSTNHTMTTGEVASVLLPHAAGYCLVGRLPPLGAGMCKMSVDGITKVTAALKTILNVRCVHPQRYCAIYGANHNPTTKLHCKIGKQATPAPQ